MTKIKKYIIPIFEEEFNEFGISYFGKEIIESVGLELGDIGYYGVHGGETITEKCESVEEAEGALVNSILEIITTQHKEHSKKLEELSNAISEISSPSGISKYLVA